MDDEIVIELEEDVDVIEIEDSVERVVDKDYEKLINLPKVENVTLIGNKSLDDLNIQPKGNYADTRITNTELEQIFNDW